jgi:dethiobiotin synthetase
LILIVGQRQGYIDAAKQSLKFAATREAEVRGAILNALDRDADATIEGDAEALARAIEVRVLGTVRFKEPLSLSIVDQLF